ncbi:30S ribosomal protein S2 [Candidatus Saccharibacteria bacterium RIFCSPHIGHO2_12_FULL_49_19]|nr:MAG: 30S ribosomal protein S2 [Candidatus Saccharibacteria bacterium RIFCSPHIGHO2_12_FULL_49_19]
MIGLDLTKKEGLIVLASIKVDIKQLLEAGAHFGHKTSRWHPRMAPYIHSKREGSHIIDLTKTIESLDNALAFLTDVTAQGKKVLLVGTKRQARDAIKAIAEDTGMPYVTQRWLGGMLTNQNTIGSRIRQLKELERRMENGELAAKYGKLEVQRFLEEIEAMNHLYGGIKDMDGLPAAVFVADTITDYIPIREARRLNIPVVAVVDTNSDPSMIAYPIPANDDAIKTIELILDYVKEAILAGKAKVKAPAKAADAKPEEETKRTAVKEEKKPTEADKASAAPVRGIG